MIGLEGLSSELAREINSLGAVDVFTIFTLAGLEAILSIDNSLVLAILVRDLPKHQQKKALAYGVAGAFIFRIMAIIFAAYLMGFVVFKLIGGAYLLFLAMKHMFFFHRRQASQPKHHGGMTFWRTVVAVELTDIAFAIDSITAAVAMTDKLLIIWLGGVLGIIFLRFMAGFLVRLLERLPRLEDLAYQLIFFIGTKLFLDGLHVKIEQTVFWFVMGVIIILGSSFVYRDYHQRKSRSEHHRDLISRIKKGEMETEELQQMEHIPEEVMSYLREKDCVKISVPGPNGRCGDPGG